MRFEGVFVATVTPFESEGKVAYDTLNRHLEFLAANKVSGFVPCATTGEGPTLGSEERIEILRISKAVAQKHGLKVIAGCGSNSTSLALEFLGEAARLGADAGLVVTPYYNKPTLSGILSHYQTLASGSPIPIVLYNVPSRTNVNLTPEMTLELLHHPNIIGIKEASGSYGQWLELSYRMDTRKKTLLAGDDDAFAVIQILGGSGIISASANVAPNLFVRLFELARLHMWQEAFELQKKLFPLTEALFIETNPAPVKFALQLLKGYENRLRLPLVPVSPRSESRIHEALQLLELL